MPRQTFKLLVGLVVFLAAFNFWNSRSWFLDMPFNADAFPDVIVVGGGLAGLSAAIHAELMGASVLILEKDRLGGNSAKASSGMNAVGTDHQIALPEVRSRDSVDTFAEDTIRSGRNMSNIELVEVLTARSMDAIGYLSQLDVVLERVTRCGGHTFPRTHRNGLPNKGERPTNVGSYIMKKLTGFAQGRRSIRIEEGRKVTKLVSEKMAVNGEESARVVGVQHVCAKSGGDAKEVRSAAVVLASGGYAADTGGFLADLPLNVRSLPTTNGDFAVGDGIRMAKELGAELVHMDQVQVHPTSFIDPANPYAHTNFLAAEALRGYGGILINQQGKRFANELATRDEVTDALFKNGSKMDGVGESRTFAYLVLNAKSKEDFGPAFGFYEFKGFFTKYNNARDFAGDANIDFGAFEGAIREYNEAASSKESGRQDEFGKRDFPVEFDVDDVLYVAKVTPAIHYTMGGVRFSPDAKILREDGREIVGLFGAGEVTGGLHGANRLGGNSLLECVVFGRIAGDNAAVLAKQFDST